MTYRRTILFLAGMTVSMMIGIGCAAGQTSAFSCPASDGMNPLPNVKAAISANDQAFLKAVLAQDKAALDAMISNDFVYVHETGLISTKQQFLEDFVAKGYIEAVLEPLQPAEPMRQYCSTVFSHYSGHLRSKQDSPYPPSVVVHIWALQDSKWVLVHRHECHNGQPIGKQLSQEGGQNLTDSLGSKPSSAVQKIIEEREASWVYSMITTDSPRMDKLIHESLRYVHVNGHFSSKKDFMKELLGGFTETDLRENSYRQFGNTVIALHKARFRHTGQAGQSPGQQIHVWWKVGDNWVMVSRHSARFEN